jgi:hypothetical protein
MNAKGSTPPHLHVGQIVAKSREEDGPQVILEGVLEIHHLGSQLYLSAALPENHECPKRKPLLSTTAALLLPQPSEAPTEGCVLPAK